MLLDCQTEARELAAQIEKAPNGGGRAQALWRARATERLRELMTLLGDEGREASERLREDQEAAGRGELPSWLRERIASGGETSDG